MVTQSIIDAITNAEFGPVNLWPLHKAPHKFDAQLHCSVVFTGCQHESQSLTLNGTTARNQLLDAHS